MKRHQRTGLAILIILLAFSGVLLLLSKGWGSAGYELQLFSGYDVDRFIADSYFDWEWSRSFLKFFSRTTSCLALVLLPAAYALCIAFGLVHYEDNVREDKSKEVPDAQPTVSTDV